MSNVESTLCKLTLIALEANEIVTEKDIRDTVVNFAAFKNCNDDAVIDNVVKHVGSQLIQTMGEGLSLFDPSDEHNQDWVKRIKEEDFKYWKDYSNHLAKEGFPPKIIPTLDDVTTKILGLMSDPLTDGEWSRKGLVIGHVQSGKTANYTGLVSKAADAGYKLIIVIAGIHNNLRTQTQIRLEEGFVGRTKTDRGWETLGVGNLNRNRKNPIVITAREHDFNKKIADQLGAELSSFNVPLVLVIKKHVGTLTRLHDWIKGLNTRAGNEKITDIPILVIDDEADNASINTNREDLDPTRTNSEIRKILSLFKKKNYVGYTATPFANIFVDPETEDEMLEDDLFPRDFIYALDAPTGYFGPHKVFSDAGFINHIKFINDAEDCMPLSHKKDDEVFIPESLKEAVRVYLLATSLRKLRGDAQKHCSMMINASRFVSTQKEIKAQVLYYIDTLKREIKYNGHLPVERALKNSSLKEMHDTHSKHYEHLEGEFSWLDIQKILGDTIEEIGVYLINSKSEDRLDFAKADHEGEVIKAIAIGGLSLSRGLTVEGLVVSYMYRNTKMYDTLMQMGRWFGYRGGYEDLCRVWLSDDSARWYSHIASVTEELRDRISLMNRLGKSPKDFGLMVRDHPDSLIITALNKMRTAEKRTRKSSFDGLLRETHILPESSRKNAENFEVIMKHLVHIEKSDAGIKPEILTTGTIYRDVPWKDIESLLVDLKYHKKLEQERESIIDYIRQIRSDFPVWDLLVVSLKGKHYPVDPELGVAIQERAVGTENGQIKTLDEEPGWLVGMKQSITGKEVEKIGFKQEEIAAIDQEAKERDSTKKGAPRVDFRNKRGKPLFMVHSLRLVHKDEKDQKTVAERIPAFGVAFPYTGKRVRVDYMVNRVYLMNEDSQDWPSNDEDYDD